MCSVFGALVLKQMLLLKPVPYAQVLGLYLWGLWRPSWVEGTGKGPGAQGYTRHLSSGRTFALLVAGAKNPG